MRPDQVLFAEDMWSYFGLFDFFEPRPWIKAENNEQINNEMSIILKLVRARAPQMIDYG